MIVICGKVPSGDNWHRAAVRADGDTANPVRLEFVVTNAQGEWDKPSSGGELYFLTPIKSLDLTPV